MNFKGIKRGRKDGLKGDSLPVPVREQTSHDRTRETRRDFMVARGERNGTILVLIAQCIHESIHDKMAWRHKHTCAHTGVHVNLVVSGEAVCIVPLANSWSSTRCEGNRTPWIGSHN